MVSNVYVLHYFFRKCYHIPNKGSNTMSHETLDPKFEEVKGKAKEAAGKVLGDKQLEVEGLVEKEVGKAKQVIDQLKKK